MLDQLRAGCPRYDKAGQDRVGMYQNPGCVGSVPSRLLVI